MLRAAVALVVLVVAGCAGIGSEDELNARVEGPALLTKEQVEQYPSGSPARAVFEWWRAIQFDNAVVGARYYSSRLAVTSAELDRQLQVGPGALGLDRRPQLVEVQEKGDSAVVLLVLDLIERNPNGRVDRVRSARSFNLERDRGEWKLADNLYLERIARVQRAVARLIRQAQTRAADGRREGAGGASP